MPAWDPIDHLLALDPADRGISAFFTPGAAIGAAQALRGAARVLITTGYTVAASSPETDGPPGAAVLGRALRRLGARVRYVTDPSALPVLEAVLRVLGEPARVEVYPEASDAARRVLSHERPTHLVAVERAGRARSGDYLNARGASIAAWTRPIDALFLERSAGTTTIGVGDGGNEIGMGNVRSRLVRQGALMARIASVVETDHLVVAGTSNWGAYGVVAALGRLTGRSLLHDADLERRLIEACVKAGAVDGISRRGEATVDALPLAAHAAFVELLRVASSGPPAAMASIPAARAAGASTAGPRDASGVPRDSGIMNQRRARRGTRP